MLCTAQSDTLCAILHSIGSIRRCICIGSYLQLPEGICPFHHTVKIATDGRFFSLYITIVDLAG